MGSVLYLQSGGPTTVINSSLNGVIRRARDLGLKVYGALHGIDGLIRDRVVELTDLPYNRLVLLRQTPGMALGSTRHKIDENFEHWKKIEDTLIKYDVDYLIINGGNDSMNTGMRLHEHFKDWGLKVVGVPKTIDNDLMGTDFCPGYPSACRAVMNTFACFALDALAYPRGKVNIVEIQGRNAGWLTASIGLLKAPCTPDILLLPESEFDEEKFLAKIKEIYDRRGCVLVAISEGLNLPALGLGEVDSFGHKAQEGVAFHLGAIVKERLGVPVRAQVFGTLCRAIPYTISKVDSDQAQWLGEAAVDQAYSGVSGVMLGLRRSEEKKLHFTLDMHPFCECADKERMFPLDWIGEDGLPNRKFANYLLPLLKGDMPLKLDAMGVFQYCTYTDK